MKISKKILCLCLTVIMVIMSAPLGGFVDLDWPKIDWGVKASAENVSFPSGKCGDNVYWFFDFKTGVLTISGTGEMFDYGEFYPNNDFFYIEETTYASIAEDLITKVVIEKGITKIGNCAFYELKALKEISISDTVNFIGDGAFVACTALNNVIIPESVISVGRKAFSSCTSLSNICISSNLINMGYDAFNNTAFYENDENWENNILYLDKYLIKAKSTTSNYDIKDGTVLIAESAFSGCNLITVNIAESVISIGKFAFKDCRNLTTITVDGDNVNYSNDSYGVLFNKDKTELIQYPEGNKGKSYSIPDSVTSIGECAFYDCSNLKSITIPNSVTSIGEYAFYYCSNLENITIPDSVTSIGKYAFGSCNNLTSVTIPDSVTSIGDHAFNCCRNLESITIGDGITSIGGGAFNYTCFYENDNNWEDDVLYIGKYLIKAKSSITSCDIKSGTICIADYAVRACKSLESITIPNTVINIGESAFEQCVSLESVTIPDSVINIGNFAFRGCTGLTNITVDVNNMKYSSDERGVLFDKNKALLIQYPIGDKSKEYILPKSIETIDEFAFYTAVYLEKIVLPQGLTTIKDEAFEGCSFLSTIEFPESLNSIGWLSFSSCMNLTEITLPENLEYVAAGGIFDCVFLEKTYIKSMDTLLECRAVGYSDVCIEGISKEDYLKLLEDYLATGNKEILKYVKICGDDIDDDFITVGTIYCHSGSTAEAYAIANNMSYVLTHFFEGDWTYDYDKMIRYRKCIHCDELETENLESTKDDNAEIIAPTAPNSEFTIDEVSPGSDNYIMIEEAFNNYGPEKWQIIKAFDINMIDETGVKVQPDGTVRVILSFDSSNNGIYKVYRVNDDGTLTDMHAFKQGNSLAFDTDHFSIYAILDESFEIHIHSYTSTTVSATCIEEGSTTYTCSCGDTYTETIAPTGHTFSGSKCTTCGYDRSDSCSCNCHSSSITHFFFVIVNFFQKLFGQNKVCSCGKAH